MNRLKRSDVFSIDDTTQEIWSQRMFSDIALSCQGCHVFAHKAMLSLSSEFVRKLILDVDDPILVFDGFRLQDVENLVSLIYNGELTISASDLANLEEVIASLMIHKDLFVKSLVEPGLEKQVDIHRPPHEEATVGCVDGSSCHNREIASALDLSEDGAFYHDDATTSYIEIGEEPDMVISRDSVNHSSVIEIQEDVVFSDEHEHFEEIGDIVIKTKRPVAKAKSPRLEPAISCERCNVSFTTLEELEEHAEDHAKIDSEKTACRFCAKTFDTSKQRDLHLKVCHEEVACKLCNVVLSSKRLNTHMKIVHDITQGDGKRKLVRKKPGVKSKYIQSKQKHTSDLKGSEDGENVSRVQCPHCLKSFSVAHLNYHIRLHHSSEPVFNCSQCKKIFRTEQSRDAHKQLCTKATAVCNFCNESYRPVYRKAHMMRHVRESIASQSADSDGFFQCGSCDRKFEHVVFLENHMFSHFWPRCKYECSECASVFVLKKQIDDHLTRCAAETRKSLWKGRKSPKPSVDRPVIRTTWTPEERRNGRVCETCGRRVKSSSWTSHVLNHKRVTDELTEQYSCDACQKSFFRQSDVEKHIQLIHRKDGKKRCSKCKIMLSSERELIKHRAECKKVYTKICSICNLEIDLFQKLKHLKAHAEDELESSGCSLTLQCPQCGPELDRTFPNCEYLVNHMINHYEPFRAHECQTCFLGFKTQIILEKHKATCNGPAMKETKGGIAKKRNGSVGVRNCDVARKKSQADDVLSWKCPACSVMFDTKKLCELHIEELHQHREESVLENETQFVSVFM